MRTLYFLLLFVQACLSYKYLVYSPLFGHSHTTFMAKIADTLTAAGHDVTFLVVIMDEDGIGKKNVSLTKHVIEVAALPETREMMEEMHRVGLKQMWEMSPDMFGMIKMARNMSMMFSSACENLMNQDELIEELRQRKYDVGISEPFSSCGMGLFDHIEIPATIGAISTTQLDIVSWYLGEPIAPSYVPNMSGADGDRMGFFARAKNLLGTLIGFQFLGGSMEAEAKHLRAKLGSNFTSYGDLISKSSFMFTNANPYLNYPRPLIHKTIEIGGITIDAKNPGPLDKEWDKILNERKHTVFISFGSVARSKDMPELWKKSILDMCASLPDVTFIWKYEIATTMADHLPNVHLAPWLPQNALLADKRLSLFVTHGGLGSTTEVAHIGKPAVMIPLFGDQPRNAEMLSRHGGAIALHKQDLAKPEVIKKAVKTILEDPSYAHAATRLAHMLKEQPFNSKDMVVRYSEFVAKFGSLDNLEPYGRHLSIIEYYLIDVIFVALSVVFIILALIYVALRWVARSIFGSRKTKLE